MPSTKVLTQGFELDVLEEFALARAELERAKKAEEVARAALLSIVGEAESVVVDGQVVLTAKEQTARRIDVNKLKVELPEVYGAFLMDVVSRPLRWKGLPVARKVAA